MSNIDTKRHVISKSVDDILAFISIIEIASDVCKFRKWVKEYHHIDDSDLFTGYKFFLTSSINKLMCEIHENNSLDFEEDLVLDRANYVDDLTLDDLPCSCEKTIVLKNIWTSTKNIRRSKDWRTIEAGNINLGQLFLETDNIIKSARVTRKGLSKEDALKYTAMFYLFNYFNDTCRGRPLCTITSELTRPQTDKKDYYRSFKGYVYTLQYVWYQLLGDKSFEKSCLKNLHRAFDIYESEVNQIIEDKVGVPVTEKQLRIDYVKNVHFNTNETAPPIRNLKSNDIFRNDTKIVSFPDIAFMPQQLSDDDIKKMEEDRLELIKLKDWYALDLFYGRIHEEIIQPIESKINRTFTGYPLLYINKGKKNHFSPYRINNGLREPDYFTGTDNKSLKKMLGYKLLWYQMDILDTQGLLNFNGTPALVNMLLGIIRHYKINNVQDKPIIRLFKHPYKNDFTLKDEFEYSLAVLIESRGMMSDGSGWIVFYRCADDDSTQGIYNRTEIKSLLKEHKNELDCDTFTIDIPTFKEYLTENCVSSAFDKIVYQTPHGSIGDISLTEIKKGTNEKLDEIKGKFFEYIFNKWLQDKENYDETKCDFYLGNEQIDCMGIKNNIISVFECKLNAHSKSDNGKESMDTIITQINNKVRAIKKSPKYKGKDVQPYIVTYYDISQDRKDQFVKKNIKIDYCDMENKIKNSCIFEHKTIDILNFEWDSIFGELSGDDG